MYVDRHKKFRAVTPYNGYKIKDDATGWVRGMNIYTPNYDTGTYHNVLNNMRKSLNYIQDEDNFKTPFKHHLQKTGFDAVPVVCVREWETNPEKRKRKFGSENNAVIDYPDPQHRTKRLAETTNQSQFGKQLQDGEPREEAHPPHWQYTDDQGKPWDLKSSQFYKRDRGMRERAHLWMGSYSCRFRKNRSTDFYLSKRDNSVMPAAGIWSRAKKRTGLYRESVASKVREENERKIKESIMREQQAAYERGDREQPPQGPVELPGGGKEGAQPRIMRASASAYAGAFKGKGGGQKNSEGGHNYRIKKNKFNQFINSSINKKRDLVNSMISKRPTTTKAARVRGKYSGNIFETIMKGPSKANIQEAIRVARDRSMSSKLKKQKIENFDFFEKFCNVFEF